ncbi:hypothetical protein EST38_g49 [Candolleomyces aberdarensis]|uniref:Bola-like protein n=1 Tax=Candolleomyces aberdarensis TaxID=2316362 RepID=A0A4Q2DZP0_9AGAR|nr:hypothetical protein EST38_g49 [Candolleomyces aberdarensis]
MFSTFFKRQLVPSVQSASSFASRRAFASSSRLFNVKIAPPPGLPDRERTIWDKLITKFSPSQLQVEDVSGGCGTFYAIVIASDTFKGLSVVKQHRLVTSTLKQEIEGIHGLQ